MAVTGQRLAKCMTWSGDLTPGLRRRRQADKYVTDPSQLNLRFKRHSAAGNVHNFFITLLFLIYAFMFLFVSVCFYFLFLHRLFQLIVFSSICKKHNGWFIKAFTTRYFEEQNDVPLC